MAQYGKNNYFDGVILPEPKEEMLRRMAKGVNTTRGYDSVVQWLDSAPQLPEANGILPPLDASVGGYDLAAIGNPKIVV